MNDNMQNLMADLSDLIENNDVNGSRRDDVITVELLRAKIERAGGSVIIESQDFGKDRIVLWSVQKWTAPDDCVNDPFCVAYWCMDGHIAHFVGPVSLREAFTQFTVWLESEIFS